MSKRKDRSGKKQTKTPASTKEKDKAQESHEIFTAKRLIIMFAILEILIIALMFPTFRGRWHRNQAKGAVEKDNFEKAYKHYDWLGENTPAYKSATFHLEFGNVCYKLEKYEEALGHYQELVELTDGQKGSHLLMGLTYLKLENNEQAREHFEKELERDSASAQANFHLGKLAFGEGEYSLATRYFSRVAFIPSYRRQLQPYWDTIEEEVLQK